MPGHLLRDLICHCERAAQRARHCYFSRENASGEIPLVADLHSALSTLAFVCHLLRDRFDSVLRGGGGRPTQFPRRRGRALDERVLSLRRNTTQNKNQELQLDDKGESQKRAETD